MWPAPLVWCRLYPLLAGGVPFFESRTMSDKDPSVWAVAIAWLQEPPAVLQGFVMALLIAVLRVIYDRKEKAWQRIALEGLLCGFLTIAGTALAALAIGFWFPSFQASMALISVGLGGTVGFFGVEVVRQLAIKVLRINLTKLEPK